MTRWAVPPEQNFVLDSGRIASRRDVGNDIVHRGRGVDVEDVVHDVVLSFLFQALNLERRSQGVKTAGTR